MPEYLDRLSATKAHYPFRKWIRGGLPQYTEESCGKFVQIFDLLIEELAELGPDASEEKKLECFHHAVLELNALNDGNSDLIETGESEDLCELCNLITIAAGLDPTNYCDGEGPASEWREW